MPSALGPPAAVQGPVFSCTPSAAYDLRENVALGTGSDTFLQTEHGCGCSTVGGEGAAASQELRTFGRNHGIGETHDVEFLSQRNAELNITSFFIMKHFE